jgi:hypothetical protein
MSAWKPRFCQWCGKAIKRPGGGKDAKKYCGKPCYFSAVRAGKQQFKGRCHDAWAAFVDWSHEWDGQRPKPKAIKLPKARPPCQHCGNEVKQGSSRFCCYECVAAWRGVRSCDTCGVTVEGCTAYSKARCTQCRLKAEKEGRRKHKAKYGRNHRQRARNHGVAYVSVPVKAIYERDGYRCQICRKRCWKVAKYSKLDGRIHPRSPSIDHIVPMSKGGCHEPGNLQTACFECNSRKSNKCGGQLRMAFV